VAALIIARGRQGLPPDEPRHLAGKRPRERAPRITLQRGSLQPRAQRHRAGWSWPATPCPHK